MRGKGFLAAAAVLAAVGALRAGDRGEDVTKEVEKLQGTWKLVSQERDGKALRDCEPLTFIVWRNWFGLKNGAGEVWGTLHPDPAAEPRALDLTFTFRRAVLTPCITYEPGSVKTGASYRTTSEDLTRTSRQIYELDGDQLTLCGYAQGDRRPRGFRTRPDSGLTIYRLRRETTPKPILPFPQIDPTVSPSAPSQGPRPPAVPPPQTVSRAPSTAAPPAPAEDGSQRLNTRTFQIPLKVEPGRRREIRELRLFVSQDKGESWGIADSVPPDRETVMYAAPRDGAYWFVLQVVRSDGTKDPQDITKLTSPQLKVVVDTKAQDGRTTAEARKPIQPEAAKSREDLQGEVTALRAKVERLERRLAELERLPKKKKHPRAADE